jgi:ABC-2 type transport system ATP-binding protein
LTIGQANAVDPALSSDAAGAQREAAARLPASRPTDRIALEIVDLSHSYGTRPALQKISFSIVPGDFTVLLGLNGAGKSTLFSLVTRLYAHRSGTIKVFGATVDGDPVTALTRMGVVFQQSTLDLDLTVEQNLRYHAALHGVPRALTASRIAAELARVDLVEQRGDRVRRLSGGQRRRVEIARALLHDPRLLLLDEPTVGLDVAGRQFLLEHVRGLCRDHGLAVLWATHLIDEVGDDARVIVLHRGRVLADGRAPDVAAAAGAASIRAAFDTLVGRGEAKE